jgi:hypothetical protein
MSALGQSRHMQCKTACPFTPKADMCGATNDVRFGPLTSDLRLEAPQQSSLRYSMRPAAAYAI